MHNPLSPVKGGIVGGHSSGSAAPTSWVRDKFEFAASARAEWLDFICLANQTGVLTTHGHDIVVDTVLSLLRMILTVTGNCFPIRLQHVPRRFLIVDSGGQTQVHGVRTRQLFSFCSLNCSVHSSPLVCPSNLKQQNSASLRKTLGWPVHGGPH